MTHWLPSFFFSCFNYVEILCLISCLQLVMRLMRDLQKLYPEIVLHNQISELKGASTEQVKSIITLHQEYMA